MLNEITPSNLGSGPNSVQSREGDTRSNADTQTALRGISPEDSMRNNQEDNSSSDISVVTISRLLEQMEGGPASGGMVAVPTVIFFTDSEVHRSKRCLGPTKISLYCLTNCRFSLAGLSKNRTTLAEPLLICDLPGQNISLGTQLRDNSDHVLDSLALDGRVDGPDLSLHTLAGT